MLAVVEWVGLCAGAWWLLPEQLSRRAVIKGGDLYDAAFGPENQWLATFGHTPDSDRKTVEFWDTTTGQSVAVLLEKPPGCEELVVSPDGNWLLTCEHDRKDIFRAATLRLWNAHTGVAMCKSNHLAAYMMVRVWPGYALGWTPRRVRTTVPTAKDSEFGCWYCPH